MNAKENENLVGTNGEEKCDGVIGMEDEVVNKEVESKEHQENKRFLSEGDKKSLKAIRQRGALLVLRILKISYFPTVSNVSTKTKGRDNK